jgi:hypothetical protein
MAYDLNSAGPQRSFEPIPVDTAVEVVMQIRPGAYGEGGWLTKAKGGGSAGLDCELTVLSGEYTGRKIFDRMTLEGTTDGHSQATDISHRKLRAIIESVRGIHPKDTQDAAIKARQINSWGDLDNIRFAIKVGVEPAKGQYAAKNTIKTVITPDQVGWKQFDQGPRPPGGSAPGGSAPPPAPLAAGRPDWAR